MFQVFSFFCLFPGPHPSPGRDLQGFSGAAVFRGRNLAPPSHSLSYRIKSRGSLRKGKGSVAARGRGALLSSTRPPAVLCLSLAEREEVTGWEVGSRLTCRDPASPLNHSLGTLTSSDTARVCVRVCVCLPAYVSGTRLHFLVKILSKIPAKSLRSSGKYALLGGSGGEFGV